MSRRSSRASVHQGDNVTFSQQIQQLQDHVKAGDGDASKPSQLKSSDGHSHHHGHHHHHGKKKDKEEILKEAICKKKHLEQCKKECEEALQRKIDESDIDSEKDERAQLDVDAQSKETDNKKPGLEAQRHYIHCLKEYNMLKLKLGTLLPEFNQ